MHTNSSFSTVLILIVDYVCTFDGIELLLKLANSNVHNFENARNSKWELFDLIIYSRYLPKIF